MVSTNPPARPAKSTKPVIMIKDKETRNFWIYKETKGTGIFYLPKDVVTSLGNPEAISVTVEVLIRTSDPKV